VAASVGTLYRGREGMWSWVAHRITGVAVFLFLFVHVLDTALVRVDPQTYDAVIDTYKTPIVNLLEVGLVGAVLFHAYHRAMLWTIMTIWLALMVPGAYFMLKHTLATVFGVGA
jgi:succinate dehydrogenase / fumarate reductase cytochrome b subunit